MCGIVTYIGNRPEAAKIVFEGLKKLEYRGYDSWGIYAKEISGEFLIKKVGKISDYQGQDWPNSHLAIGHTRWATHGGITENNAHPHFSFHRRVIIVHNGVVENYLAIKQKLLQKGYQFHTQTDTEIVANLFDDYLGQGLTLLESGYEVAKNIEGRNAVVALDLKTQQVLGFRNGSPLVLGLAEDGLYLASDVAPFGDVTRQVIFLEDGEGCLISGKKYTLHNLLTKKQVKRESVLVNWSTLGHEKGDKASFLEKEIFDQKEVLKNTLKQNTKKVQKVVNLLGKAEHIYLVGAGTAGKVGQWGAHLFNTVGKILAYPVFSSEFRMYENSLTEKDVVIVITQSGETADTLEAMKVCQEKHVPVVALVNVEGSTIYRTADYALLHNVGVEKAVASTKATTAPMILIAMLVSEIAKDKRLEKEISNLVDLLPEYLNEELVSKAKNLAQKLYRAPNIYLIGRGASFAIAQEGAIKIQELSNIHAEGVAGGELKHYAISLIEQGIPCLVIVGEEAERKAILSNAMEVKARGGLIIGFDDEENEVFDYYFPLPKLGVLKGIANLIPLQLLAYYLALARGCDPDYCRNLAKSVTVI